MKKVGPLAFSALLTFFTASAGAVRLTLVVDPGHGGEDLGVVTSDGTQEKTLALEWAIQLRDRLGREGDFAVILTRDHDVAMTLDERAVKANQSKAHLYMGIHMNQVPSVSVTGSLVRVYKPSSPIKRAGAANVVSWKQAQMSWTPKSRLAGADLVQGLSRVAPVSIKEGPWVDLRCLALPAVAVEVGYLSSSEEASRLRESARRQEVVEALVEGLKVLRVRMGL